MNSMTPTFRSGSAAAMLCVALAMAGCPAQPSSDRAARLSLQVKPNGVMPGSGELVGAPGSVATFLESFKRSELQSVMTCRRQAA
jgi:hypothetical protein